MESGLPQSWRVPDYRAKCIEEGVGPSQTKMRTNESTTRMNANGFLNQPQNYSEAHAAASAVQGLVQTGMSLALLKGTFGRKVGFAPALPLESHLFQNLPGNRYIWPVLILSCFRTSGQTAGRPGADVERCARCGASRPNYQSD
jgi:hypothetical protein